MKINRKKVELLLAERMLTYSELAEKYGVCRETLYRAVNRPSIRPKTAGQIATVLGVPVDDIIEKED